MWKHGKDELSEVESPDLTDSPLRQVKEGPSIGPSIRINGEIGGDGDLTIEGHIEGKIDLKKSHVTVGQKGRVTADIYGKIITIEGEVNGNLFGKESIEIRQSASVRGNLVAPRLTLEDGARFQGSIDMNSNSGENQPLVAKNVPDVPSRRSQKKRGLAAQVGNPAAAAGDN